ncbi:LuxR C-terminal-related transcriptional regulator [Pantoea sp. GbtcB22]|uniref:LuxR C-terminal-related transcriptional regulator n=1 Tax=Pantoea sp. GbtcB22 TaxID=2824767 RepID=UPI001C2F2CE0|nr:LuxR C-terminal-related transcriptional regulator [Pantoea sp. GbtcB22]
MFTMAILESDKFAVKGLTDYFCSPTIGISTFGNLSLLSTALNHGGFDVVIMELVTHDDNFYDCVDFARHFSKNHPETKLIIYTRFTDKVLMQFVAHHITKGHILFKHDSLRLLASYIFLNDNYNLFHSSSDIKVLKYIASESTLISLIEWNTLRHLAKGLPLTSISREINVSVKTISQRRKSLMTKMACKNSVSFYLKLINSGVVHIS